MDEDERAAIRTVLGQLRDAGEDWIRQAPPADTAITSLFQPLKRNQLSYLLHQPSGQFEPNEVVQLVPPIREWRAAALRCEWKSEGPGNGCAFYLGIWLDDLRFIGFRFEPPAPGNHSYYHCQPCRTMGGKEPIRIPRALELPERNPAWPLHATSSLELLLCLVLSILGMDGLQKMRRTFGGDPMRYRAITRKLDQMLTLWSAT